MLFKTLALPPTFVEQWRQAVDAWRGPPSDLKQLSKAIDAWRGPPSSFQQLREFAERIREGADLQVPDAHAPPKRAPAPTARRGRQPIHDWPRIKGLDAEFCRTHCAATGRAPTWKQRREALRKVLGSATPHLKTLQKHLPKIAL